LRQGPIFANIILADEINRASRAPNRPCQSLQEYQVTLKATMKLNCSWWWTQNPIEYEGTFPLPEAQLTVSVKLSVGYPSADEEQEILHRRRVRKQDASS
jgi:MoxR-like ATPase